MEIQVWKFYFAVSFLVWHGANAVEGETKTAIGQLLENVVKEPTKDAIRQLVELAFRARVAQAPSNQPEKLNPENSSRVKRDAFYRITCPHQTDQSAAYNLANNPLGYPTDLIANELFVRSLPGSDGLFQCLLRTAIQPNQDPQVEPQPALLEGSTCPQALSQLWTYTSVALGNRLCWFLASFQEDILYNAGCLNSPCLGCKDRLFFDCERKLCIPRYRTVSLWAFCPSLPVNQRIVRDRIIIPSDCSCSTVTCQANHPFGYCLDWKK